MIYNNDLLINTSYKKTIKVYHSKKIQIKSIAGPEYLRSTVINKIDDNIYGALTQIQIVILPTEIGKRNENIKIEFTNDKIVYIPINIEVKGEYKAYPPKLRIDENKAYYILLKNTNNISIINKIEYGDQIKLRRNGDMLVLERKYNKGTIDTIKVYINNEKYPTLKIPLIVTKNETK